MFSTDQDPVAQLTYQIDWSSWLQSGDGISIGPTWTIFPTQLGAGTDLVIVTSSYTATTATVVVKGGINGTFYTVKGKITTALGEVDARSIQFHIVDR